MVLEILPFWREFYLQKSTTAVGCVILSTISRERMVKVLNFLERCVGSVRDEALVWRCRDYDVGRIRLGAIPL